MYQEIKERPIYIVDETSEDNKTYKDNEKCSMCKIGGYCGGGCEQSARIDFDKQCHKEKEDFEKFMNQIFYPRVMELLEASSHDE